MHLRKYDLTQKNMDEFIIHCHIFRDQCRNYDLSIERLCRIIDAMEELLVLKDQYNLHVHFEEYFQVSAHLPHVSAELSIS